MSNAEVTRYHQLAGEDFLTTDEEREFQLLSHYMRRQAPVYTRP